MAEYGDAARAGLALLRREGAPRGGTYTEHPEEVLRYDYAFDWFGYTITFQVEDLIVVGGDVREVVVLRFPVDEVRIGDRRAVEALTQLRRMNGDEFLGA